jgi:hypothetical protein
MSEPAHDDGRARRAIGYRLLQSAVRSLTLPALLVLFYGLVTPLAVVLRLAGRDRLRLRRDAQQSSYWAARTAVDRQVEMTRQS